MVIRAVFGRVGWAFVAPLLALASVAGADTVKLVDLGLDKLHQEWGDPQIDKDVSQHPLIVGGATFAHGIGTHAAAIWWIYLGGAGQRFNALVGLDDDVKIDPRYTSTRAEFQIVGDHKILFRSGPMKVGDAPKAIDVDLHGIETMVIVVTSLTRSIDYCHADLIDPIIEYGGQKPLPIDPPPDSMEILTPPPPTTPQINGAKVLGVRTGHPLLYTIAATGTRPISFLAEGFPAGLSLDSETGRISGSPTSPGKVVVKLTATNSLGTTESDLRIEVGDAIALTPPMGWNSWNCFAGDVSDDKMRAAVDAMVGSGLINHGWTYINVDDCWQVRADQPQENRRDADGHVKSNQKFPDMKALADYIHSKGLRAGLYSSPGPATCAGFTGSYQFADQDAQQYAQWGFDYLKYDWCSYDKIADGIRKGANPPSDHEVLQHPYNVMSSALLKQNRDIVFSLCQYGIGDVWEWGQQVGGNCWRTTGDISDNWGSMSGIGFGQAGREKFAGPGHWNDPDMLVVGNVGWGPALHPTHLTPNEQYTHITLWSLLSAPLLIGCDMTHLDDFTLGLLTNDEVIAVDQDPLGKQATAVPNTDAGVDIYVKDLADGSKAVGLFNRSEMPGTIAVNWADLGLTGTQNVRDLWRQKDLGGFEGKYSADVGRHGVVLIKISAPKQ
jgi:alpha-galactosidase